MEQFDPPYPAECLREDVLPALGLSVAQAARALGIDRRRLSRVLHGRSPIDPDLALRIEAWLGVDHGGSARQWLAMQSAHDLWHARQAFNAAGLAATVQPVRRDPQGDSA